ncbi:hypothetical protein LCGC14_2359580 [marine sediment metagenome]|uniref:Uncharacterized protein n=1 Tax=marine sediment metagenome TaxID=412755 RepID=A0A0F9F1V5_9ZZZZ
MNKTIKYIYRYILKYGATVISCETVDNAVTIVLDTPESMGEQRCKMTAILYQDGKNTILHHTF